MDFHSLTRRDLQALCKKNRIPANITNAAMADALQALQTVEGIAEAQQYQSPKKQDARSPDLPRTGRRTSTRRAPVKEEPKEGQASPLPRARRVTARASEVEEEVKQEPEEEKLKTPAARTGRKTQAPTTRRRTSKKDEEEEEGKEKQEGVALIPPTPASCHGPNTRKRASKKEGTEAAKIPDTPAAGTGRVRHVVESPVVEVVEENATEVPRTQRRTRQSTRKQPGDMTMNASVNAGRRSTRANSTTKMASLAQETDEPEAKDTVGDDTPGDGETKDQKQDADELQMGEMKPSDPMGGSSDREATILQMGEMKPSDPMGTNISDFGSSDREATKALDSTFDDGARKQDESSELETEDSPIRGLVVEHNGEEEDQKQDSDGTPDEENGDVDLDFYPQETPIFIVETPAKIGESSRHLPITDAAIPGDVPITSGLSESGVGLTPIHTDDAGVDLEDENVADEIEAVPVPVAKQQTLDSAASSPRPYSSPDATGNPVRNQPERGDVLIGEILDESGDEELITSRAPPEPVPEDTSSPLRQALPVDPSVQISEAATESPAEVEDPIPEKSNEVEDLITNQAPLEPEDSSSPLHQALPSIQISEAATESPAKSLAEVVDPIPEKPNEELMANHAQSESESESLLSAEREEDDDCGFEDLTGEIGSESESIILSAEREEDDDYGFEDLTGEIEEPVANLGTGDLFAPSSDLSVDERGSEKKGMEPVDVDMEEVERRDDKEKRSGEAKVRVKAKKHIHYSHLSMRKLRAIYKEKLTNMKNSSKDTVEGERTS